MTTRHELDRSISTWLQAEAPDRAPDDVLEASRERLRHTRQRRAWMPAWRYSPLNNLAKAAVAAAVVLVVGFAGYQLLPRTGGVGGQPTVAPSPTPSLLARGTFTALDGWADVEIDATGGGSDVSGRLVATAQTGTFTIDLECARSTADGLLWIGGDVTASTDTTYALQGSRTAIVFKRGTPAQAVFVFQINDPRSASCLAFFDDMLKIDDPTGALRPIEGTVELAP
jgi:hypothetical protein